MKRKTPIISVIALSVAAVLGAPSQVAAADGDSTLQFYGHFDLSFDVITKGIDDPTATGKLGWQPSISSNLSYVGFRGDHDIGGGNRFVFQAETQIDVSATPGPSPVNQASQGNTDNKVQGALASRNSFLGIAGGFGAVKLGKTDAPYKLSTARMDPFSATIGDYNAIMGNTGGDNRAEFDTRLSHAMWYESPKWSGWSFSALWAPGQNRSSDNSNNASGEPNCTGGGGGQGSGIPLVNIGPCNDGSFGDAYSAAVVWESGPIYVTVAAEDHVKVNRTGDEVVAGTVGAVDERAYKAGIQWALPSNTVLNAIVEKMTRAAPVADLNERQRNGWWLAVTQKITPQDDINIGWGHAGKTPGDPGTGPIDNQANLTAIGYKHHFDKQANWYAVYARQQNQIGAHYDLGASGHGITTDCKDAAGVCFTGKTLQGVSVGLAYSF